jgi:hypothetical protein
MPQSIRKPPLSRLAEPSCWRDGTETLPGSAAPPVQSYRQTYRFTMYSMNVA